MKPSKEFLTALIEKLTTLKTNPIRDKVFVGFDGYVDKIRRPVKIRTEKSVEYYETITEFSERIALAAGKSGQIEMVTDVVKLGGNAPIMANSLGHLGIENFCLGNSGYPARHPAYNALHQKAKVLSAGNPAESIAIEFNDGKIILSDLSIFRQLDWNQVKKTVGFDLIKSGVDESSVIALVGWCNPDHATDVWKGLLNEVMPTSREKKLMFFDLADPTKKSKEDLMEVLEVINSFAKYGKVVLGLNENETLKLYSIISENSEIDSTNLTEKAETIYNHLKIEGLLIHPVDRSIFIDKDGVLELEGKVVKNPKISTGGGDNLNSGFCLGYLMGLTPTESMMTGMITSGSYVQNGESPDIDSLIQYLQAW